MSTPSFIVETWLLLADQQEGFTQASQLQGLAVNTTNLCPLWRFSSAGGGGQCSDMVYSCPLGMQTLGFPGWCRPRSVTTCVLPRATQHELQTIYRWLLLVLDLEDHGWSEAVIQGWLLLVLDLGPISKRYGMWGLTEASCGLFERT